MAGIDANDVGGQMSDRRTRLNDAPSALAVIDAWVEAFNARDVSAVVALYADDTTFLGTTSSGLGRNVNDVHAYFSSKAGLQTKVQLGSRLATPICEDGIAVAGDYYFSGIRVDGTPFCSAARYTFVLAKRDDRWSIVHHHSSLTPGTK